MGVARRNRLPIKELQQVLNCGAAGLGIVLAVGGVGTQVFQAKGDARPGIAAPVSTSGTGGQDARSQEAKAEDPHVEADRIEHELDSMRNRLDRLNDELAGLKAGIERKQARLKSLRGRDSGRRTDSPRHVRVSVRRPVRAGCDPLPGGGQDHDPRGPGYGTHNPSRSSLLDQGDVRPGLPRPRPCCRPIPPRWTPSTGLATPSRSRVASLNGAAARSRSTSRCCTAAGRTSASTRRMAGADSAATTSGRGIRS